MNKKTISLLIFSFLIFPTVTFAQSENLSDKIFKARVIKIIEEKNIVREDGSKTIQQNILVKGLEGVWKNQEYTHLGISELDIFKSNIYKIGDKVLVNEVENIEGGKNYYIVEYVRSNQLFYLALIFGLIIILISKKKGIRSLIGLAISFLIIIKVVIPKIISGSDPLVVGVLGAFSILTIIIYITEGINKKSHIAVASVFISLIVTFVLSLIFTYLTRLTGTAQEETIFLLGLNGGIISFKGLLLTGILIGTIGVLDDVIVGQVEAVKQLKEANSNLTNKQIYKSAYEVGNSHLGAIVNTLFLTYAGASLPLLLLFYFNPNGITSFTQIINNELIATEIVRTLVGSIGVALSMPIATFLATILIKRK